MPKVELTPDPGDGPRTSTESTPLETLQDKKERVGVAHGQFGTQVIYGMSQGISTIERTQAEAIDACKKKADVVGKAPGTCRVDRVIDSGCVYAILYRDAKGNVLAFVTNKTYKVAGRCIGTKELFTADSDARSR
jgi:hypothetical protein